MLNNSGKSNSIDAEVKIPERIKNIIKVGKWDEFKDGLLRLDNQ